MSHNDHPHKEIRAAIDVALEREWRIEYGQNHVWCTLKCTHAKRDGCIVRVAHTPQNPEGAARRILREINACPHQNP